MTHGPWLGEGFRGPFLGTADDDLWTLFWRAFRIELAYPSDEPDNPLYSKAPRSTSDADAKQQSNQLPDSDVPD